VRDTDGTFRTAGGRVLSVVGRGADLAAARIAATDAADRIHAAGLQRRHDIAAVGTEVARLPFATTGAFAR
jgi:phosphoribosylamine--glycine ligase